MIHSKDQNRTGIRFSTLKDNPAKESTASLWDDFVKDTFESAQFGGIIDFLKLLMLLKKANQAREFVRSEDFHSRITSLTSRVSVSSFFTS